MKTKRGFVSNSSTASFVLMGFDASDIFEETEYGPEFDGEDIYELGERLQFTYLYEGEGGAPPGVKYVVGRFIHYIHSDDWSDSIGEVDIDEIRKFVEEIRRHFRAEEEEIKVWKGTMLA